MNKTKNGIFMLITIFTLIITFSSCGKKYQVTFIGFDNQEITTLKVTKKEKINYPAAPVVEGYEFISWDKQVEYTESDLTVTAIYQRLKYSVSFYNSNDELIETKEVYYGDSVTAPNIEEKEGYEFIKWDQDIENVTSDLIVKPLYKAITFIVTLYDANGDVYEELTVEYGKDLENITPPTLEGHKFIKWDQELTNILSDLEVHPIYQINSYNVKFLDLYGNLLTEEMVEHNSSATPPSAPEVPFHIFERWSYDYKKIKGDVTIRPIYNKTTDSYPNSNVNYWLRVLAGKYDINKILLTEEEINNYNDLIVSDYNKTEVVDVTKLPKTTTIETVSNMICGYQNMYKYTVYKDLYSQKVPLSREEQLDILNNRDIDNITGEIKYGIVVDFAWLRSYPTNYYSNDYDMDRFQETSLNVGEGVVIYHTSHDGNWYFVQAQNYNGWIEKQYVGLTDYDTMYSFVKTENKLVVISDYVLIENAHVRMGQYFPLLSKTDDNYTISFPINNNGSLELKEITLGKTDDYSEGFLDYTYKNIFTQAFKLLGIDYSWGDKSKLGRDCSSTMNGIYQSFGFMMPRNTTNQVAIPQYGKKVSGVTVSYMESYNPGTLIFTSSHVMMYLGKDASNVAYLLHNTTSGNGECILQSLTSYGGNRINGILELQ